MYIWILITHAWVTDDAYFTFRTIDNWVNGYGLTWNIADRVQVFTHPLWMFLLAFFYNFTREIYLTSIVVSIVVSLLTAGVVVFAIAHTTRARVIALMLLGLSSAYVDFSSSGLENPLTHLILAVFLFVFLRKDSSPKKLVWLSLIAALGTVDRLDTVLLYVPVLIYEWLQSKNKMRALLSIALGFIPLIVWELFSLIYYGFLFPNSYFAKLNNYLPVYQKLWSGLHYFVFTLVFDPLTLLVIVAGILLLVASRQRKALAIAIGVLAYLAYVVWVGGDFMGGRFLTAAYLAATIGFVYYELPKLNARAHELVAAGLLAASLFAVSPPYLLYAKNFEIAHWNDVQDQRMRFNRTSLLRIDEFFSFNSDPAHTSLNNAAFFVRSILRGTAFRLEPEDDWVKLGRAAREQSLQIVFLVLAEGASGFSGFYAGPLVHYIDSVAITEPFLSRLPPIHSPTWRPGHFYRLIPRGYRELVAGEQAALPDPELDTYLQDILLVTRGSLFSAERWAAIWHLNTKDFADLAPDLVAGFRFPGLIHVSADEAQGGVFSVSGNGSGLQVALAQPSTATQLEISLSANDSFEIQFLGASGQLLGSRLVRGDPAAGEALQDQLIAVPAQAARAGFAAIRIVAVRIPALETDQTQTIMYLN